MWYVIRVWVVGVVLVRCYLFYVLWALGLRVVWWMYAIILRDVLDLE